MISARRSLTLGLTLAAALVATPAPVRAQAAGPAAASADAAGRAALGAERQRVRADLERTNAEIDALKRSGRSLRDDYRLRALLADAEALARRLTALDARLGGGAGPLPVWPTAGAEPRGLPTDGPTELEAKADILSDQARRLATRGDALLARASDLRARQNLRRRFGQMERDPFSPLEGAKRRAMASSTLLGGPSRTQEAAPVPVAGGPAVKDSTTSPPPPTIPTTGGSVASPGFTSPPPGGAAVPTNAPTGTGSSSVSAPALGPTPTSPAADGLSLSTQLRDLLDPTTLAELQRLESTRGVTNNYEALERAGAALKARAERMARDAAALRARSR
jgi:hypothetical protein